MKKLFYCLALVILTGCVGLKDSDDPNLPSTEYRIARAVVYSGAITYLKDHRDQQAVFEKVKMGLEEIQRQDVVDPLILISTLQQLPIKEFKSDDAVLYVGLANLLLTDLSGKEVVVTNPELTKEFIAGLIDGIDLAIAFMNTINA